MNCKEKILIVDDDQEILTLMITLLTARGYEVFAGESGKEAIAMAALILPELILLNPCLPDMDGLEVLRRIREWSDVPVIIVSARHNEKDKIEGLDSGANDYITKPFGTGEMLARIRAAIRNFKRIKETGLAVSSHYKNGRLEIDYGKRIVMVDKKPVHLTPIEYKIVVLFSQNTGKVLTHDFIIQKLWGAFASDSQLLRVNIANIRRKLEENPAEPAYILTEVGVGYRMWEATDIESDGVASM